VTPIGAAFVALVLLVLLFVVRGALHHPAHVVLPQDASSWGTTSAEAPAAAIFFRNFLRVSISFRGV